MRKPEVVRALLAAVSILLTACASATPTPPPLRVGVVLDTPGENDRGFNENTLKGAREAAAAAGLDFAYIATQSPSDYEKNIE